MNESLMRCAAHRLRDLLVLESLEVAMLVHAVGHCAALWLHPALCHEVQLCVPVHGFHFSVIVIVSREAACEEEKGEKVKGKKKIKIKNPNPKIKNQSKISRSSIHFISYFTTLYFTFPLLPFFAFKIKGFFFSISYDVLIFRYKIGDGRMLANNATGFLPQALVPVLC